MLSFIHTRTTQKFDSITHPATKNRTNFLLSITWSFWQQKHSQDVACFIRIYSRCSSYTSVWRLLVVHGGVLGAKQGLKLVKLNEKTHYINIIITLDCI